MARTGRPKIYKEEYSNQAYKLCADFGADDKKLAKFFECSVATVNNWKIDYPNFLESIKKGKAIFDDNAVEKSLLQRALGYNVKEMKYFAAEGIVMDEREVEKHIPGDVTATIFWLKNRQPGKWRDKTIVESEDSEDTKIVEELDKMDPQKLKKLRDSLKGMK